MTWPHVPPRRTPPQRRVLGRVGAVAATLLAVESTGCDREAASFGVVPPDTADVPVVLSPEPAWGTGSGWRVAEEPSVVIGVEQGPPEYQFFGAQGALILPDGRIAVANSGTGELRFFDPRGRFVGSVGRQGQGPGEFSERSTLDMWLSADSLIAVTDNGSRRINLFDLSGRHLSTVRFASAPGGLVPRPRAGFDDGTWLGWVNSGALDGQAGEVIRSVMVYFRFLRDGGLEGEVFRHEGQPRFVNQVGSRVHYPFIPLSPAPLVATDGTRVLFLPGPTREIRVLEGVGGPTARYRWGEGRLRLAGEVYGRYKEESLKEMGPGETFRRYARFYDQDLPIPEHLPCCQSLVVDALGYIWVERYRLPWEGDPRWDVLDASGRWLGSVGTPTGLNVIQVGADFVLGSAADSLGVERIVVYTLSKRP